MTPDERAELPRRRFLAAGALALTGAMAGCSDDGSTDTTPTEASTTDAPGDGIGTAAPDVGGGTATEGEGETPTAGDGGTATATPVPGPEVVVQFSTGDGDGPVTVFHGGGAAITPENTAAIVLSTDGAVTYPTDAIAADGTVEGTVAISDEIAVVEDVPESGTVFVFWKGPNGAEKLLGKWQEEG